MKRQAVNLWQPRHARYAAFVALALLFSASCAGLDARGIQPGQRYVLIPGNSIVFWQKVMDRTTAAKYQARGYLTQCNVYLSDMIRAHLGETVWKKIFPDGLEAPDELYRDWQKNPFLQLLDPEKFDLADIQRLADRGFLVLLSYYYDSGPSHVAFVGARNLVMFTLPPIAKLEGKKGGSLDQEWLPVVVQAGTYTGVTSAAYATNGWFGSAVHPFESGIVKFYLVRI